MQRRILYCTRAKVYHGFSDCTACNASYLWILMVSHIQRSIVHHLTEVRVQWHETMETSHRDACELTRQRQDLILKQRLWGHRKSSKLPAGPPTNRHRPGEWMHTCPETGPCHLGKIFRNARHPSFVHARRSAFHVTPSSCLMSGFVTQFLNKKLTVRKKNLFLQFVAPGFIQCCRFSPSRQSSLKALSWNHRMASSCWSNNSWSVWLTALWWRWWHELIKKNWISWGSRTSGPTDLLFDVRFNCAWSDYLYIYMYICIYWVVDWDFGWLNKQRQA